VTRAFDGRDPLPERPTWYSIWLIAFGVVLVVRERRGAQAPSAASRPATS
jgi:hypothetical protein